MIRQVEDSHEFGNAFHVSYLNTKFRLDLVWGVCLDDDASLRISKRGNLQVLHEFDVPSMSDKDWIRELARTITDLVCEDRIDLLLSDLGAMGARLAPYKKMPKLVISSDGPFRGTPDSGKIYRCPNCSHTQLKPGRCEECEVLVKPDGPWADEEDDRMSGDWEDYYRR